MPSDSLLAALVLTQLASKIEMLRGVVYVPNEKYNVRRNVSMKITILFPVIYASPQQSVYFSIEENVAKEMSAR